MINTCGAVYCGGAGAGCAVETVGLGCTVNTNINTNTIARWRPMVVR